MWVLKRFIKQYCPAPLHCPPPLANLCPSYMACLPPDQNIARFPPIVYISNIISASEVLGNIMLNKKALNTQH